MITLDGHHASFGVWDHKDHGMPVLREHGAYHISSHVGLSQDDVYLSGV